MTYNVFGGTLNFALSMSLYMVSKLCVQMQTFKSVVKCMFCRMFTYNVICFCRRSPEEVAQEDTSLKQKSAKTVPAKVSCAEFQSFTLHFMYCGSQGVAPRGT